MDGWIKLHRSLLCWGWWDDIAVTRLWLYILLTANHGQETGHGVTIQAGQLVTGRKQLAANTGLSEQQIRTALKKLESTHEITTKTTNRFTVITVVKWADYQVFNNGANQQITNKQPTNNQQTTTNKNDKNEKNDKKVRNIFRKPTLEEVRSYISEKGLNVDAEYFYDYYESNGWTVGKNHMKSWQSTLNNWSRREKKKGAGHVVIEKPSYMGTGYDPDAFKW
jgi:DNA-binding transcriptional MocR family regulator